MRRVYKEEIAGFATFFVSLIFGLALLWDGPPRDWVLVAYILIASVSLGQLVTKDMRLMAEQREQGEADKKKALHE